MTLHRPLIIIQRYGIQRASLPPLTFTYLNQDWAEDLSVCELSKLCSLVVAIALGGSKTTGLLCNICDMKHLVINRWTVDWFMNDGL